MKQEQKPNVPIRLQDVVTMGYVEAQEEREAEEEREPEPAVQIVSLNTYIRMQFLQFEARGPAIGLLLFSILLVCLAGGVALSRADIYLMYARAAQTGFANYPHLPDTWWLEDLFFLVIFSTGIYLSLRGAQRCLKQVPTVRMVPLIQANIDHLSSQLSVAETLVRASSEPAHSQEAVLLRAATGKPQAGQEGQLLRAVQE